FDTVLTLAFIEQQVTEVKTFRDLAKAPAESKYKSSLPPPNKPTTAQEYLKKEEAEAAADKIAVPVKTIDIKLELWTSPIGYEGYKYFRETVTLYGFNQGDPLSLIIFEGNLYLKTDRQMFRLTEQNEFNTFVPVNERRILDIFDL
ncbi:MAG: hypothetical protein M3Q97_10375, partial [Bacteroidota bacterium]|nr:hypothetical protein [Bacteroidota bacterium]